jgi:hypothetical protein
MATKSYFCIFHLETTGWISVKYEIGVYAENYRLNLGRATAQAVSRRLLTAAARVQTRFWSCEIL